MLCSNDCGRPSKPSQSIQSDLMDIMISASELAHAQAAKIVSVRSDQHAAIQLSEFVDLFNESWSFVVKSEIICKRMIVGLRGVVAGQVRGTFAFKTATAQLVFRRDSSCRHSIKFD